MNKKYIALLFSLMAATAPTTVVQSAEAPKNEMKKTNKDSKMKKTILFAALGIVIIFVSILGYRKRKNLVRWFNPRKHTHSHKRTNDWNDSDDGESSSNDDDIDLNFSHDDDTNKNGDSVGYSIATTPNGTLDEDVELSYDNNDDSDDQESSSGGDDDNDESELSPSDIDNADDDNNDT